MITLKVEKKENGTWQDITSKCQYPISISQRLDRELDGGSFAFISNDSTKDKIVAPLTRHRITASDSTGTIEADFVGASQRALMRNSVDGYTALFKHNVALTETTKLLEGVLIDGMGVTQPNTGAQKSLYDVVKRLLKYTNKGQFVFTDNANIRTLFENTESPQFRWSPQSTLWECLLDIASVIDAIPYLEEVIVSSRTQLQVNFLLLNTNETKVDTLIDEYTYSYGESVNEQQYNSKLSAIVENIKEL